MIGGNVTGFLQVKEKTGANEIGEGVFDWIDKHELVGWLDLLTGDSPNTNFNAKIQESTNVFICDYTDISDVTAEDSRLIINNQVYQVQWIDDPMELHQHLEIMLKYIGGGLNG